jgi:hypothetical protein
MAKYNYKNREIRLVSYLVPDAGWVPAAQVITSTEGKEHVRARKGASEKPCKTQEDADLLALKFAKAWIDSH